MLKNRIINNVLNVNRVSSEFSKKVNLNVIKRYMLTSVKKGATSMTLAKETFFKFCLHFKNLAKDDLYKDPLVIQFFCTTIANEAYLCNRAFQLTLDVTYSKREFARVDLNSYFEKYFSMENPLDRFDNKSNVDQSTLFTALQSKILKEGYPQFSVIVNQTPTDVVIEKLSLESQKALEINKQLTGNRFPDVSINGIQYDYKFSKDIYNAKNQIYMMPESTEALKKFAKHIYILKERLEDKSLPENFRKLMLNKANIIHSELLQKCSIENLKELVQSWNNFAMSLAEQRPNNFGMPIFIITSKAYIPDPTVLKDAENLNIAEGHLDQASAKVALKAIIGSYPQKLQNDVYNATKGSLGHLFDNDTTID